MTSLNKSTDARILCAYSCALLFASPPVLAVKLFSRYSQRTNDLCCARYVLVCMCVCGRYREREMPGEMALDTTVRLAIQTATDSLCSAGR